MQWSERGRGVEDGILSSAAHRYQWSQQECAVGEPGEQGETPAVIAVSLYKENCLKSAWARAKRYTQNDSQMPISGCLCMGHLYPNLVSKIPRDPMAQPEEGELKGIQDYVTPNL